MGSGIDPTVDYVFKLLFAREAAVGLTSELLNAVLELPPGKAVREVEILNPFTEKEFAEEKVSVFDVKAKDQAGRYHHVEMQRGVPWSFGKRVLYYWAGLHGQQMLQGDYYETLCPTFSVCFLAQRLFDDGHYPHTFRVQDAEHGVLFCKDLEIHTVELSKFAVPAEQVKTPLERWCYFLSRGADLDPGHVPAQLDTPAIRQALEVLMRLSQDERERFRYLDRLMYQRDTATREIAAVRARDEGIEIGREEGRDEGLKEGRKEGRTEGMLIAKIQLCQQLLKQPVTPTEELERLSVEELAARLAPLEQQALPGGNGSA